MLQYISAMRIFSLLALSLAISSCKPAYPKCDSDDQCKEKGEVCVNSQCQECREDVQCTAKYPNEKRECVDGRCDIKPECRTSSDCAAVGPGLVCRTGKCLPECAQDTDCGANKKCLEQKCVAECSQNVDCGPGRTCVDGQCHEAETSSNRATQMCRPLDPSKGDVVNLENVHFEFNSYELSSSARDELNQAIECLKQAPAKLKVVVEGHCDDRGTQEYNLALGEKRARAVMTYFKTMGLPPKRFSVRSKGENEPLCTTQDDACWGKNRRVQFIQKMH